MSRAKSFINEAQELFQYAQKGNTSVAIGKSEKVLQPGIYKLGLTFEGQGLFTKNEVKSDALLNLRNGKRQSILTEFRKFWNPEVKSKFENLGLIHKRGFIYEGPPGTGKSCDMKLLMNEMVNAGDVVFIAEEAGTLATCLKQFKDVEPNRHVAVIMEDFERMADYGEHTLLELLDGPNAVGGVFYLGTTNFINRISERLRRKSRFDRVIHVGLPEYEDRLEYFKSKLEKLDTLEAIENLAKQTAGRNFADMKDIIVAIYCLGNSLEEVLLEMNGGCLKESGRKYSEEQLIKKLKPLNESIESLPMTKPSRALQFLEIVGSLDKKSLANHDKASPKEPSKKDQDAMAKYAAPLHQAGNMPDDQSIYKGGPIDAVRVIKQLNQRLALLNIHGVTVQDVDSDKEGSIFVTFADDHDNEMEAEFNYDDNDQANVYVDDYEMALGDNAPGAVTTAFGKYLNLYDPLFLEKDTFMNMFAQGGLKPTKDRLSIPGKDAFGNRSSAPQ